MAERMRQHYSTLERSDPDPIPESARTPAISHSIVVKKMNGERCMDLLYQFMRRMDKTYTRMDAEDDYRSNPIFGWQLAQRELFLQENQA